MVQEPVYLDLSSSSDEDEEDRNRDGSTALLYLSKVFHVDVDDDEVRIIDKPASNRKVKRDKPRAFRAALEDDDCCILDTDPGAADAAPDVVSSLNTDELVMTGEKGPVACRDFPHARYLCVHFPFKSTRHSQFCAQCHCYVCDSLAPCSLWGEGKSPNDHCHASEEPRWKNLRKYAKYGPLTSRAAESRLVQSTILQSFPSRMLPIAPVVPVALAGVVPQVAATVKRDPFVIHLKGKGRGKVSQPTQPLEVTTVRQPAVRRKVNAKRSAPRCVVSRSTSPPSRGGAEDEPPATIPFPSVEGLGRSGAKVLIVTPPNPEPARVTPIYDRPERPIPATIPQPPHTTPNPSFRARRYGGGTSPTASAHPQSPLTTPNPNYRLGRPVPATSPPPLQPHPSLRLVKPVASSTPPLPRSTRSSSTLPKRARGEAVAASAPQLHPVVRNKPSTRAAGVAITKLSVQHRPQPAVIPNSAPSYVTLPPHVTNEAPSVSGSSLRDQQVSGVRADPVPGGHGRAQPPRPIPDFVAHSSRTPVDNASSSHTFDIVADPIDGWEMMNTAADYELARSSLHDVIQQMAADDSLWEQPYPGWQ